MNLALISARDHVDDAAVVDGPLINALAKRDVNVTVACWDDHTVNWGRFDAAVVRTVWNYQHHRDTFLATIDTIATQTQLINPAPLIRWNTHKNYLVDLEEQGAPVIQTVIVPRGSDVTLDTLARMHGFEHLIIKPAVGAGGRNVTHGDEATLADTFLDLLRSEDMVVQPYVDTVATDGELSVIVCGNTVSHAVRKTPPPGDFRAHERYGARYRAVTPTAAEAALALWLVAALHPHTPTIARIDLLADANHTLYVSEVELTEPNLYLTYHDAAAHNVADAVINAVDA